MFLDIETTIQFACLTIVFLIWFLAVLVVRIAQMKQPTGINIADPRTQYKQLPPYATRAFNAHNNTMEGFVFLLSGILANFVGNGNKLVAASLCVAYTLSRALFVFFYITDLALPRAICFGIGLLSTITLLLNPFFT